MQHSQWLFRLDPIGLGLNALKKMDTQQQPFKSEKVLKFVKELGGLKSILKWLEYLTMEAKVIDGVIHSELGCLYVQYIRANI